MIEFKKRVVEEVSACTCDRCGRRMDRGHHEGDLEFQERVSIDFTGGYGSVFGDGDRVQLDLCQHCVKETLGEWIRVTPQ